MQYAKILVGWFMQCLACKTTFIYTAEKYLKVESTGRILRRNAAGSGGKPVGSVKCPRCRSPDVCLMEIGDSK
ncbi:MAG TPA: hypothetical protein VMX13_10425 [Sedimentisphaerales bacterium]|nr:hypothetical protein [Sedimentisphaerales bacterium]